jgi:hypothetical protein
LKNGDYDVFNENEALAEQAIVHAQQFYQVEQQEAHQAQFEEQYMGSVVLKDGRSRKGRVRS